MSGLAFRDPGVGNARVIALVMPAALTVELRAWEAAAEDDVARELRARVR